MLYENNAGDSAVRRLYDGADLIAEYNFSGTLLRRYVHGPGGDEPLVLYEGARTSNKTWFYADALGSIIAGAPPLALPKSGLADDEPTRCPFGQPHWFERN